MKLKFLSNFFNLSFYIITKLLKMFYNFLYIPKLEHLVVLLCAYILIPYGKVALQYFTLYIDLWSFETFISNIFF